MSVFAEKENLFVLKKSKKEVLLTTQKVEKGKELGLWLALRNESE